MKTYLASVHRRWEELSRQQATDITEPKDIYRPYTQDLADKIRSWLNMLDTQRNNIFYECDLCQIFKCKKEDLAIASSAIPLYRQVTTINGVRVHSYSMISPIDSQPELNDVQLFILNCLQRGYITTPQNGWRLLIPSVNFYEAFIHSEQYQRTSRSLFGRELSKMGFAKSILAGNPPYRCRSFKLKPLNEARCYFATIILGDEKYDWE
ncbi:hypothetical protein [Yersinia pseudotuberculosis]|uniref:hypothetical protein n=1 Tax=Yersinia pseudotuberculosis TaxID=633 RepID=UPI001A9FD9B6|nr:hypothetical protein [Yersinia pseudotuberculosis]MBO1567070.1 hypothetical protein [Yersinia pseudotuberculosis]MBO1603929.1 hypothetical protein [Yersinia pseudotuberculosis]